MVQAIIMLVTGLLWLIQGYFLGYQLPFVDGKPVLIVLGQVTQGLATLGGIVYLLLGLFLLYERKKGGNNFEVGLYYNTMMVLGIVLLICTIL